MAEKKRGKMLIALDGSDRAFETIKYVSEIPPFREMRVVLYSVVSKIPERYWDFERQPNTGRRVREIRALETHQQQALREYMDYAKARLVRSGFPGDSVAVKIHERQKGIARDIIAEARRGYAAVVVGRRGMSQTRGILLGSVAIKLLEKVGFVPLFVVGRYRRPEKVLLALDGSEVSMQIVDYVGRALPECDCEVTMAHVIRGDGGKVIQEARDRITRIFQLAKSHLVNCGFRHDKISAKIIPGALSRAGAIVNEANDGGYCTIVVGRRGLTQNRYFFMGRVSNKVVQMAKDKVVWVIS